MADGTIMTSIGQTIQIEPVVKSKRPRIKVPGYLEKPVETKPETKQEEKTAPVVKKEQKKQNFTPKKERQERPKMTKEERYEKSLEALKSVISRDGGKFVSFDDKQYLLVAGAEHDTHLYFMVMNKNREIEFIPMKSTFKIVREVDASMGVVNYLLERQKNDLVDIIMEYVNLNEEYKVVTDMGVKPYVRNSGFKKKPFNKKQQKK